MRPLKFLTWWLLTGWLLVALVITFSLISPPPGLPGLPGVDKLAHLAAYGVLTLWFGFIYLPGLRYVRLGLGLILMGGALELIQEISGHRSMDYYDMLANATGVAMGWVLAQTRLSGVLARFEAWMGTSR
jgi:VanZ family protein